MNGTGASAYHYESMITYVGAGTLIMHHQHHVRRHGIRRQYCPILIANDSNWLKA